MPGFESAEGADYDEREAGSLSLSKNRSNSDRSRIEGISTCSVDRRARLNSSGSSVKDRVKRAAICWRAPPNRGQAQNSISVPRLQGNNITNKKGADFGSFFFINRMLVKNLAGMSNR